MSPSRASLQAFSRLLDAAAQPVYVVDEDGRIVLVNFALTEWCGRTAEELVGQECRYHSDASRDSLAAVTAALCPPPEALFGQQHQAVIRLALAGQERSRQADFLPLTAADGAPLGVLAVLAPSDAKTLDASPPPSAHEALRDFHQEWKGRSGAIRLVGQSPALRRVRAQVALAATSDVDVLIVGPPGSGRRHVAHAIDQPRGDSSGRALVVLEGRTATLERLRGVLEAAAGRSGAGGPGALLITDVDGLSPDLQFALAEELGGTRRYRVLATSRVPLAELIAVGFRTELAHQLATLTVQIPPLKERSDDLPLLAQAFIEERNAEGAKQVSGLTPEALETMAAYPWPGEVEELRDFVRNAHQAAEGARIAVMHWPTVVRLGNTKGKQKSGGAIVLSEYLEQVERELIERTLAAARGNKAKAARQLGMTRPRLYRRMVQLGLAEAPIEEPVEFHLTPEAVEFDEIDDG